MDEVFVDYLDSYRKFFDKLSLSVDPNDQLPVKVAGYNLIESEVSGAVADWALQYLEQRRCPPILLAHLVRKVVEEVKTATKINPLSCGYRSDIEDFLSLKLMQTCISKLVEVCARYRDNSELSSLPPPSSHAFPPVTSCAIKNSRRSMEDRHVIIHDFHTLFNIKGHGPASYYGVFDGHNGVDAAIYSVSHLHQYLAESAHYPHHPVRALRDACTKTDDFFTIKAQRENLHGGSTAVFALLRPKDRKLYVAWLGDSQAVLVRQGIPLQIVRPHKPDRSDEKERIESMGGAVLYWGAWRVNGQLAVSRAIGDIEYKPYVTAEPDIEEITLDGTEDFLILACDGLWDFVSEQQATRAVYKQLQENSEDLEAVSNRLVALAKEQSSQDNISVVVVFLAEPSEVAKRRLMETASPNPFVSQNGSELYRNGQLSLHEHEDDDFGPETDVDMVDDVLLSPAIAAAKSLLGVEDDLERQRQQTSDFDDPADLDKSRDTPTPPAHEVASNANADNLADSGGEESEEEWNYIPGKDTKPESVDIEDQDDMSSQLNPNAAEFVPVSPTRLLMMDDAIISASPRLGFEKSLENVQMPTELEFSTEISQRPGDLEMTNGSRKGDDYFMRDNFSTLRNKGKDFNVSSTCAELGDSSIISFASSLNNSAVCESIDIPFDKLEAVQRMEEKVTSCVLENEIVFGTNDGLCKNAFGATNIFSKSDSMTTSMIESKELITPSPELEDGLMLGSPQSTIVEAPVSPSNEDISSFIPKTDFNSPVDDEFLMGTPKTPEQVTPREGPEDELTSAQERTSSPSCDSESGLKEYKNDVIEESNDGFITEHRRSPPLDLSFKPIQSFSDTNPFGALQTPSSVTPLNQPSNIDLNTENAMDFEHKLETPKKDHIDDLDILQNTPSFISSRSPNQEVPVPFDELASPDVPHFEQPPNANSSLLVTELPESVEHSLESMLSPIKQEHLETNIDDISCVKTSSILENESEEVEETSFTIGITNQNEPSSTSSHVDLDTTEGFLVEESKILQDLQEHEQESKLTEEVKIETFDDFVKTHIESGDVSPKAIEKALAVFDDIKDDTEFKPEVIEEETKEMTLEFESQIASSISSPEDLRNTDEEFEVIRKEELNFDNISESVIEPQESKSNLTIEEPDLVQEPAFIQHIVDFSPTKQTNPFAANETVMVTETVLSLGERKEETIPELDANRKIELINALDDLNSGICEDVAVIEPVAILSSTPELSSPVDPEASKTDLCHPLTPVEEPEEAKTRVEEEVPHKSSPKEETVTLGPAGVETELDSEVPTNAIVDSEPILTKSEVVDEPVLIKSEPVQSQVVTETLITALEETSEVPSSIMTEVIPTAGTPPPTPVPGVDSQDDAQKADILVAAVAAAGAVAAGSAIIANKEIKKDASKKTTVGSPKKADTAKVPGKIAPTKAPLKPAPTKAPTTTKPTTTKPAAPVGAKPAGSVAQKPTGTAATKPQSSVAPKTTKPASATAIKKPAETKPAATKPAASTLAPKTASTTASKSVPKQLAVTKTSGTTLKPSSKPTTPTSKPTTPTTPNSPSVIKSPPRPAPKSTLASAKTGGITKPGSESAEKKALTNGEVKPLPKKTEVVPKTGLPAQRSVPLASKPTATQAKAPLVANKTAPKNIAQTQIKAKPQTVNTNTKPAVSAVPKRPSTAPVTKTADKTGKEAVNKQISNVKPAVNGKAATGKPSTGVKKTDTSGKPSSGKPVPVKKIEEIKKEEKPVQIQEDNVTTTNGFAEHFTEEHQSVKIEELSPVIINDVN